MITYLWITGILALVLVVLGAAVLLALPEHLSDGDYGQAVLGVVIGVVGLIIAVIHGAGWLEKMW